MKLILADQKFGNLLVVDEFYIENERFYKCQCDCGNETSVRPSDLFTNKIVSCGCVRIENLKKLHQTHRDKRPINIGDKIGELMILSISIGTKVPMHRCKCSCGVERDFWTKHLRSGKTKSCGCVRN